MHYKKSMFVCPVCGNSPEIKGKSYKCVFIEKEMCNGA